MMDAPIFLETTIQADRNFSHRTIRKEISEKLSGKELISSTYVLGELVSNFLRNSIAFYNLLVESETTNEALARFGERFFSARQFSRVMKVFASITEDGNMRKQEVLDRLDLLIEDTMLDRYLDDLKEIINQTKCARASARPYKEDGLWRINIKCRKKPKPGCLIEEFLKVNKKTFAELESIGDKHLENCIGTIKNINQGKDIPYGTSCWDIGDAIICHESPADSPIYTTNLKDFKPICKLLGKNLFINE